MQKIKLALKVFNSKSSAEKILVRLGNESIPDVSREKHLDPLIQMFRHVDSSEGETIYDIYNHYLKHCKNWLPTMKLLYIGHELINNIGQRFCTSFLSEHFENILDLVKHKNDKNDVEDFCHAVLAANYYNFLIIYAHYFPDIHTHLSRDPTEFAKSLKQKQYIDLVQLVTFKNLIKYFTKVEECIEGSRSVLKERGLIDKISLLLFRDVITIYNLISDSLKHSMHYIFELESGRALLLDELYSDTIQLTNKLRQMIDKAGLKGTNAIPVPHYFTFDPEFNKQEELYILELKKAKPKSEDFDSQLPYKVYMIQYQTLAPGKKKYKLNSGVGQLTRVTETSKAKTKQYFNLDDDSFSPIKADDENTKYRNISDAAPDLLSPGYVDSPYKDITNPLQLEIQLSRNKSNGGVDSPHYYLKKEKKELMLDYDPEIGHRKGGESVIFSPTSQPPGGLFGEEGSPDSLIKKDRSRLLTNLKNSGKKMNVNPANF